MSERTTILDAILAAKRAEISRLRGQERGLARRAADAPPARAFEPALRLGDRVAVIAEFKRRSPSAGPLAPEANVADVVAAYERGGASALSVLTDRSHFGGSLADLRAARDAASIPVLRKDFLLEPVQLLESRAAGADAVLLIARALEDGRLREMVAAGEELGMAALVEVHDREEVERALAAGARIVGVNARDLASFEVDLPRALELVAGISEDRVAVAESGIGDAADAAAAGHSGADAVLVGSRLMGDDPEAAVAELVGQARRRRVAVKICGCRTPAEARTAVEAGAAYVGLVFAEGPRRVSREEAKRIVEAVAGRARPVGVFVDADPETVRSVAGEVGIEVAQLHGGEPPEACEALRAAGIEVWKAVRPRGREELHEAVARYREVVDALLVEGWSPEGAGGTGTRVPLEWLEGWRERLEPGSARLVLAGGLRPATVADAVSRVRPDVVDVSSGVERRPGEKDPRRIRVFVREARAAGLPGRTRGAGESGPERFRVPASS
ncbi:MAG: bifunctional indole-3-glycerol phosphate synthase/phosphoribosylanthranilate isomerase [Gemmatimonadota bacterium]